MNSLKEKKILVRMKQRLGEDVPQELLDEIAAEEAQIVADQEKQIALQEERKNAFKGMFSDLSSQLGQLMAEEKKKTAEEQALLDRFSNVLSRVDEIKAQLVERKDQTTEEFIEEIIPQTVEMIPEEIVETTSIILAPEEPPVQPPIKDPIKDVADKIKVTKPPSMFVQPDPAPVSRDIKDIQNKLKLLEGWVGKISMSGPGGGAVWLRDLDDVARSSVLNATEGQVLTYNETTKKWEAQNPAAANGGYVLPTASTTVKGGVKIDGTTITINNQVISANFPSEADTLDSVTDRGNTTNNTIVVGNVIPAANLTYNLGNTTNRWTELFLGANSVTFTDTLNGPDQVLSLANQVFYITQGSGSNNTFNANAGFNAGGLISQNYSLTLANTARDFTIGSPGVDSGRMLINRTLAVGNTGTDTYSFIANSSTVAFTQTITANGNVGTTGQVLASNGTGVYWTSASAGANGANGIGISSTTINGSGNLVITYSNTTTVDVGHVVGATGSTGATGANGANGSNGTNGSNGISVTAANVNSNGYLIITYSNTATANAGYVVGPAGANGSNVSQIQTDWNQSNVSAIDFIKNKPTIPTTIDSLTDVTITGPQNNQVLTYNTATAQWINQNGASNNFTTGYYGGFVYTGANVAMSNTANAYVVPLTSSQGASGISLGTNNDIVFAYAGTYELCYSIQIENDANDDDYADVWIRVNGVNLDDTNSVFAVNRKNTGGHPGDIIAVTPFQLTLAAGDSVQVMTSSSTGSAKIVTIPAQTNPTIPRTPGVIVNVQQIASIVIPDNIAGTANNATNLGGFAANQYAYANGSNFNVNNSITLTYAGATPTGYPLIVNASNTQGGSGYADFLKVTNKTAGATANNKSIRLNNTGAIEIINSAYTATILSLSDTGALSVPGPISISGKQAVNGPAFSAYANNTLQTITSGSQQKVLFQTEEFDTNNNFASSRFTPTVEGYYQLNAEVRLDGASGTGEMMIILYKNGSEYKRGTNQSGTQIATNFWAMQVSSVVYANGTSDYFEIYVQQGSGGSVTVTAVNNSAITWFNGCMLRGG